MNIHSRFLPSPLSNDVKIELDNKNLKQFERTMHNNTTVHPFVDFYKDNTCAITQDTITGNAVTLNSTSTYNAEGKIGRASCRERV